ncbi:Zinc finger C2H2-type protein [Macrophomina phaseolina MS6]|uniref:Zinc finger C2H2-type protein n=2 Tax=Macrophomina phaseolina TaxID=35725 RepID=K2RQL6_MACPH|nr:Zinc finger C2H2-type protein [Macrophomina phaseolina MS6]KAH7049213.1 transcription factor PacC [Macrophomina phaseolina]
MSAVAENPSAAPAAQPAQAASTPQQQHQQPVQQAQTPSQQQPPATPTTAGAGDSLTCQWQNCGERLSTAEALYDHVCERHVGRKSTNNLNLTCQWGNCRTTTVKRDHITSHIRVHVPLKPHKCDFCGKAFKRPQDLKKHVKTHADDSVLLRSPEPNRGNPHGSAGGAYPGQAGKHVADLQALAGAASGFYQDGMGANSAYGHPGAAAGGAFYGGAPTNSAYGPVYYAVNHQQNLQSDYEVRKKATFDALNEFFGSVKRREIDPTTYYDVGQRLMGLQGQLPLLAGYGGSEYHSGPAVVSPTGHGPAPSHQYSLPMPSLPNLRTKSDLLDVDQVLEQLQSTIYENPKQAAAAGVAQPGAHYLHSGFNYRSSNSPPGTHAHQPQSSHATTLAPLSAPQTETPALTPASSVMSYASGQSPGSVHSGNNISPVSRPAGSMYPTLPSVSAMSDPSGGYPATSNAPNLAPFDSDGRRRWSGNQLQKSRPARDVDAMDMSDNDSTPSASRRNSLDRDGLRKDVHKLAIQSPPPLDPSLRSPGEQSEAASEHQSELGVSEQDNEAWVQNMRMIEELRAFIKVKLERGDFEDGADSTEVKEESSEERRGSAGPSMSEEERSLYPVLRAVQDSE